MKSNPSPLRTPEERVQMSDLLTEERKKAQNAYNKKRQNEGFTQIYGKGWARLRMLISLKKYSALTLYLYLAENVDAGRGALITSQKVLGEETGLSRSTIWRAMNYLEETGAIVRIKLKGASYAYALNDTEVWKSWHGAKEQSAFRTKTLSKKTDRPGSVRGRFPVMLEEANIAR